MVEIGVAMEIDKKLRRYSYAFEFVIKVLGLSVSNMTTNPNSL